MQGPALTPAARSLASISRWFPRSTCPITRPRKLVLGFRRPTGSFAAAAARPARRRSNAACIRSAAAPPPPPPPRLGSGVVDVAIIFLDEGLMGLDAG